MMLVVLFLILDLLVEIIFGLLDDVQEATPSTAATAAYRNGILGRHPRIEKAVHRAQGFETLGYILPSFKEKRKRKRRSILLLPPMDLPTRARSGWTPPRKRRTSKSRVTPAMAAKVRAAKEEQLRLAHLQWQESVAQRLREQQERSRSTKGGNRPPKARPQLVPVQDMGSKWVHPPNKRVRKATYGRWQYAAPLKRWEREQLRADMALCSMAAQKAALRQEAV